MSKVKEHFEKYKAVYIVGGSCLVIGAAAGLLLRVNHIPPVVENLNYNAPKFNWRPENTQMIINLIENSTPSKPVHLAGSNLYFNSMSEAARETGHSLSQISKNVRGLIPSVAGDVFELLERP